MAAIMSVFHEHQTGWHTYTSPQIRGLFLTGPDEDAQALLKALPSTICALIESMEHRSVSVQQAESYRGYAASAQGAGTKEVLHFLVSSAEP